MPDNDKQSYQVDNFSELGASGLWRTGGFVIDDILPQLRGKQAQTAYRDMSENDPIVGSILFAIERVVLQVDWRVDPYDDNTGDTPTAYDIEVANFVEEVRNDMSHSWHELITAILSFLPFGWSFFEIVYKRRMGPNQKDPSKRSKFSDRKIGWRKIVMRAQDSLWQWQFDEGGGVKAMIQRDPTTGRLNVIPIEKALLFRTNSSRGNPEGRALDPETPIPTPMGWKTMGNLEIGDELFDEQGNICHVVAKQGWEDRPRYCLGFSDGTEIVADVNHLWQTATLWERRSHRGAHVRTTEEIASSLISDHLITTAKPLAPKYLNKLRRERDGDVLVEQTLVHYIMSSEKLPNGPTVCIEVDSPSHLFLAGEGMVVTENSVLRNAFRSWYVKRRIEEFEAIGVERDLAGLPVGTVPAAWMSTNATPAEKMALQTMEAVVRGVKRNETEGIILPSMYDEANNQEVTFKLLNSGGTRQFNSQPLDAKILTPHGWTTMGEIKVGDEVIDPLGYPSFVTGVFPKGVRPVYRVTLADGRSTRADGEHLWVVHNSSWWKKRKPGRNDYPLLNGYRVMTTNEIAIPQPSYSRYHVPLIEAVEYADPQPLLVDPYVLGALLGDGYLPAVTSTNGISLVSSDPEIADEVERGLPAGDRMYSRKCFNGDKAREYYIAGPPKLRFGCTTKNLLREMGLLGKKSQTKFIPPEYISAGVKDRLSLLQGLMDTDGNVHADGTARYYTTSPHLADGVVEIVRSLGGTAKKVEYKQSFRAPSNKLGDKTLFHITIRLPDHLQPFRLQRKLDRLGSENRPNRRYTGITSIEYVGDEFVQCISVSSPSHLYVTDDFIPTHNTTEIINRYNNQIAMTVLADFIMLGHESVGSFALGASKVDLFIAAVETWVRLIAETFNSHAIPRLMSLNGYDTSRCPTLTYGQVNAVDLQELGAFLLNLQGAQLITPDNNLEDYLRELAGLPPFRPEANGIAVNTRYGDDEMERPQNLMEDEDGPFIGNQQPGGGGGGSSPRPTNARTPQGNKKNDQTGGSDIQANITSAGYTGEAPKGAGKKTGSSQSGPLTNSQGSET